MLCVFAHFNTYHLSPWHLLWWLNEMSICHVLSVRSMETLNFCHFTHFGDNLDLSYHICSDTAPPSSLSLSGNCDSEGPHMPQKNVIDCPQDCQLVPMLCSFLMWSYAKHMAVISTCCFIRNHEFKKTPKSQTTLRKYNPYQCKYYNHSVVYW